MRDIAAAAIEQAVRDLCIEANRHLPGDIRRAVQEAAGPGKYAAGGTSCGIWRRIWTLRMSCACPSARIPAWRWCSPGWGRRRISPAACCGMQSTAVWRGVYRGASALLGGKRPAAQGKHGGDNTPAVLHVELVEGDRLELTVAPKGFGSENMSRFSCSPRRLTGSGCSAASCRPRARRGSNPVRPWSWAWESAGISSYARRWRNRRFAGPWTGRTPTRIMPKWNGTPVGQCPGHRGLRASAVPRPALVWPLRPIPPTLRVCRSRSMSDAM